MNKLTCKLFKPLGTQLYPSVRAISYSEFNGGILSSTSIRSNGNPGLFCGTSCLQRAHLQLPQPRLWHVKKTNF